MGKIFNPKFYTQKQWKTPQNNPAQVKYTVFCSSYIFLHLGIASDKYQAAVFQIAPSPLPKSPFSLLPSPQIAPCSPGSLCFRLPSHPPGQHHCQAFINTKILRLILGIKIPDPEMNVSLESRDTQCARASNGKKF